MSHIYLCQWIILMSILLPINVVHLALFPGPLDYLSTGFHLETFQIRGGISRVYITLPVHHGQTQWLLWEPRMWPGRGSMPLKLPLSGGHRVELGTKTVPQPLLSCLQEFKFITVIIILSNKYDFMCKFFKTKFPFTLAVKLVSNWFMFKPVSHHLQKAVSKVH